MMKSGNKRWVLALTLLCLLCAAAFYLLSHGREGTVAVVRLDGREIYRIDLSRVEESYELPINSAYGYNCIHVNPGGISVIEADCPDGICVRQGEIRQGGIPILCMPHRLSITIEGSGIDA